MGCCSTCSRTLLQMLNDGLLARRKSDESGEQRRTERNTGGRTTLPNTLRLRARAPLWTLLQMLCYEFDLPAPTEALQDWGYGSAPGQARLREIEADEAAGGRLLHPFPSCVVVQAQVLGPWVGYRYRLRTWIPVNCCTEVLCHKP